ncbi:twin-arginine translocase TatA/TatE family subunit, partial [Herbiconiux sp. CPCC 203406]
MPFNLRPAELILILAIILLIFGAKKLPDLARGIGQSLRIFRKEIKDLTEKDKTGDDDAERETAPAAVAVSQAAPVPAAAAA